MIKRYSIDLSAQMAACDANYIRILKLLPGLRLRDTREIVIPGDEGGEPIVFVAEVVESFRYTSTVSLRQRLPAGSASWYRPPEMLVRLYHDASTAEVISYQRHRGFKPVYAVPNELGYHVNEKEQLNHFLTDWLSTCLNKGISNDRIDSRDFATT